MKHALGRLNSQKGNVPILVVGVILIVAVLVLGTFAITRSLDTKRDTQEITQEPERDLAEMERPADTNSGSDTYTTSEDDNNIPGANPLEEEGTGTSTWEIVQPEGWNVALRYPENSGIFYMDINRVGNKKINESPLPVTHYELIKLGPAQIANPRVAETIVYGILYDGFMMMVSKEDIGYAIRATGDFQQTQDRAEIIDQIVKSESGEYKKMDGFCATTYMMVQQSSNNNIRIKVEGLDNPCHTDGNCVEQSIIYKIVRDDTLTRIAVCSVASTYNEMSQYSAEARKLIDTMSCP